MVMVRASSYRRSPADGRLSKLAAGLQPAMHDMQPDEPGGGMVERIGHRGEGFEAERAPARDRRGVRFDDGVELHR